MMASFLDMLLSGGDYRMTAAEAGYPDRYGDGLLSRNRDRVPASVEAMQTGQDFVPGFGDALALAEAYDAASRGELAAAGLLGTGAVIGLVPGAGDAISRPVIAAGRNAMDLARRIEVDPNALGSMGGNIRLRPAGEAKSSVAEMRRQANIDRFGYDPNEVPDKKPSAGLLSEYVGEHQAPMRDGNAPAFNLAGDIYPDDIYSANAVQYYGTGNTSMDRETMGLLQSLRGQPDAEVKIYRAVPKGVDDLNAGDWVTVNRQYAQDHGEAALGGDFDIVERKVKAREIFTNGDSIHEFGYDPSRPLPTPRNEAEATAKQVLEALTTGRVDDVTDEMLAAADDPYLFNNYDLPMDEASRLARAREMGMDTDTPLYHGTDAVFSDFNADMGVSNRYKTGVFSSDNPDVADSYASSRGSIYPIARKTSGQNLNVDVGGGNWNRITKDKPVSGTVSVLDAEFPELSGNATTYDLFNNMYDDKFDPYLDTNALARQRRFEGDGGITFTNVIDRGPHLIDEAAQAGAGKPSTVNVDFYPHNIRSRFARFDPRLAHLRNLSAGVSGLGLLSAGIPQEDQY